MKNNLYQEYFKTSLVPSDVGFRNPYNLRKDNIIQLIHSRTTLYHNSLFPRQSELPSDIRHNPSIHSFKTYLNRNTLPVNPLFFYVDQKYQILLTHTFLSEMQQS